jgi:acylphosphatase
MGNVRLRLIVEGRVQGVWFRESTRREAVNQGVCGWVKNRADGTVEVLAEGPEERINVFRAWCSHGPSTARVDNILETREEWIGEFNTFEVVF